MRQILVLAFFSFTLIACKQKQGNKFFAYDEIDYYFNNYKEENLSALYDNQSRSKMDSMEAGVIVGDIPLNIADLSFIRSLEKMGYQKRRLAKSSFGEIDDIFMEKTVKGNAVTTCIYIYRDILIFKKKGEVIGTAKICFDCGANNIKGTTANTENFGQDGDYERLANILR